MQVITGRVERRLETTLQRVHQVLEPATNIVEKQMRGSVGSLQVAVATSRGLHDMVADSHRQLFGVSGPELRRWGWSPAGQTALTPDGTLVVINAQVLRGNVREIDKTVLHELAHAVQFSRPGQRGRIMRGELHNHGVEELPDAEVHRLDRMVISDEREAKRMERFHRLLAQTIT